MLKRIKTLVRRKSRKKRREVQDAAQDAPAPGHVVSSHQVAGQTKEENDTSQVGPDQQQLNAQSVKLEEHKAFADVDLEDHPALRPTSPEQPPDEPGPSHRQSPSPESSAPSTTLDIFLDAHQYTEPSGNNSKERVGDNKAPPDPKDEVDALNDRLTSVDLSKHPEGFSPNAEVDVDYTIHRRDPVVHEEIYPHMHTIYQPRRTRSIHFFEHRYYIQPIADPDPTVAPTEHFLKDDETGKVYKIPGSFVPDEEETAEGSRSGETKDKDMFARDSQSDVSLWPK
ncbi:hypothetical protein B0I35DRAFT_480275 [Stachybotrys elegans]|uniref:Uncharacterized protein n=1 Tax=Stachybotrys elegans TaxID=80388 RepID=A0A8K0SIZ4_9HYPO|nr:hypothetical protein B0I35DRAFT_480275 [Stachybotrys elegans]